MIPIEDRAARVLDSAKKIESPFAVDPSLCLYSPQDNVDSLQHPRILEWLKFVREDYTPKLPESQRRILLFMPCTRTKPYPFSTEHQAINQRLLDSGFQPTNRLYLPQELQARLADGFSPETLNLSPLINNKGTVIHRMVISEPMAVVPYEHIAEFNGKPSPAVAYDDPGLFENRGNAVSPWRADSTAQQQSANRWKWGDEELQSYVEMHNVMAQTLAHVVNRIGDQYTDIVSWVAPGLTHRSFVIANDERAANKVTSKRKIAGEWQSLTGANDLLPASFRISCLPTLDQCRESVARLADRLGTDLSHANTIYARGGAKATPLALPELLDVLMSYLTEQNQTAAA